MFVQDQQLRCGCFSRKMCLVNVCFLADQGVISFRHLKINEFKDLL